MTIAINDNATNAPFGTYVRPDRRVVATNTPNYLLRRIGAAVITLIAFAALVVGFNGLLASVGGGPASAADVSPASSALAISHVAQPGDTMWSIASQYRGEVDHGRYVDALIRLNDGVSIQAGQAVRLP